jgi:hypothetical protein
MIFTIEAFDDSLKGEHAATVRETLPPELAPASSALREELERSLMAGSAP